MRISVLKFIGLMLWSLFLFVPFLTARAEGGFDLYMPLEIADETEQPALFSIGGYGLHLDTRSAATGPEAGEWSLRFNAGRDSVLGHEMSPEVRHDRLPLDNGERRSLRFGIGLNYRF